MASAFRHVGVHMIDGLVKEAQMHPIDQMRAGQQFDQGLHGIQDQLGIENPQAALAKNKDYYSQVRELYDRYLGPQPAEEKAPKVISVSK